MRDFITGKFDMETRSRRVRAVRFRAAFTLVELLVVIAIIGLLFLNSEIRYSEIADGSSNTILFGEVLPDSKSLGWASGTRSSLRNSSENVGLRYRRNARNTVLPPDEKEKGLDFVGGFGSDHSGGAQFCLANGAVIFLAETIDPRLFEHLGDRADGAMMGEFY